MSLIQNLTLAFLATAALSLCACDTKGEGAPAGASAKPAGAGATAPAAANAPALRNAAGKLTKAGFDAAWSEVFRGAAAAGQPPEKQIAAFEAKVGAPAKVENDHKVWWAFDGDACFKMDLDKSGMKGSEKVPADKCEK
jgi:hypothetical protein